jgi:hypothetical protein
MKTAAIIILLLLCQGLTDAIDQHTEARIAATSK